MNDTKTASSAEAVPTGNYYALILSFNGEEQIDATVYDASTEEGRAGIHAAVDEAIDNGATQIRIAKN